MAKTILEKMREMLLMEDITDIERYELNYRIYILSQTKLIKEMNVDSLDSMKQNYGMLQNLRWCMLMHKEKLSRYKKNPNEEEERYQSLVDQINVAMMPFLSFYPANAKDYRAQMMPMVLQMEKVWYQYRQENYPVHGF